jgi:hypothetical protein
MKPETQTLRHGVSDALKLHHLVKNYQKVFTQLVGARARLCVCFCA